MNGPQADALRVLGGWRPADPQQEALRHAFLTLLDARADGCLRACEPGHVTASAVLLDAAGENVLLTLHPRVGSWLQLGGHCEPEDTTLAGAALREATEESGVDGLVVDPEPVHLDEHPVPFCGEQTHHLDVRFVAVADPRTGHQVSEESAELRWWDTEDLPGDDLAELVDLGRHRVLGV